MSCRRFCIFLVSLLCLSWFCLCCLSFTQFSFCYHAYASFFCFKILVTNSFLFLLALVLFFFLTVLFSLMYSILSDPVLWSFFRSWFLLCSSRSISSSSADIYFSVSVVFSVISATLFKIASFKYWIDGDSFLRASNLFSSSSWTIVAIFFTCFTSILSGLLFFIRFHLISFLFTHCASHHPIVTAYVHLCYYFRILYHGFICCHNVIYLVLVVAFG